LNREFAGYTFDSVGRIAPARDASGSLVRVMPQSRYKNAAVAPLNRYGAGPFCTFTIARGVTSPGVYVVTVNGKPVYAGKCRNLAERFGPRGYGTIHPKNCYVSGQSTNCKINNLILQQADLGSTIELWFHSAPDPSSIEREVIVQLDPPWNTQTPW